MLFAAVGGEVRIWEPASSIVSSATPTRSFTSTTGFTNIDALSLSADVLAVLDVSQRKVFLYSGLGAIDGDTSPDTTIDYSPVHDGGAQQIVLTDDTLYVRTNANRIGIYRDALTLATLLQLGSVEGVGSGDADMVIIE
jgi:hypothetical protein